MNGDGQCASRGMKGWQPIRDGTRRIKKEEEITQTTRSVSKTSPPLPPSGSCHLKLWSDKNPENFPFFA